MFEEANFFVAVGDLFRRIRNLPQIMKSIDKEHQVTGLHSYDPTSYVNIKSLTDKIGRFQLEPSHHSYPGQYRRDQNGTGGLQSGQNQHLNKKDSRSIDYLFNNSYSHANFNKSQEGRYSNTESLRQDHTLNNQQLHQNNNLKLNQHSNQGHSESQRRHFNKQYEREQQSSSSSHFPQQNHHNQRPFQEQKDRERQFNQTSNFTPDSAFLNTQGNQLNSQNLNQFNKEVKLNNQSFGQYQRDQPRLFTAPQQQSNLRYNDQNVSNQKGQQSNKFSGNSAGFVNDKVLSNQGQQKFFPDPGDFSQLQLQGYEQSFRQPLMSGNQPVHRSQTQFEELLKQQQMPRYDIKSKDFTHQGYMNQQHFQNFDKEVLNKDNALFPHQQLFNEQTPHIREQFSQTSQYPSREENNFGYQTQNQNQLYSGPQQNYDLSQSQAALNRPKLSEDLLAQNGPYQNQQISSGYNQLSGNQTQNGQRFSSGHLEPNQLQFKREGNIDTAQSQRNYMDISQLVNAQKETITHLAEQAGQHMPINNDNLRSRDFYYQQTSGNINELKNTNRGEQRLNSNVEVQNQAGQ